MSLKTRTLLLMLAKVISQANVMVLGLILVRMMTLNDVGTYNQAFLVYSTVSSILALNLEVSLFYFVPMLRKTRLGGLLLQSCYLTLLMGLLSAAVMYFGADLIAGYLNNPSLAPLIRILAFLPFGEKLLILVPSFMLSHDRALRAAFYIFVGAITKLLIVVVILFMKGDLAAIFQGIVVTVCFVGLLGTLDMMRFAKGTSWQVSLAGLREQVDYCTPLMITSVLVIVNMQIGKVMISKYFNAETYALYAFGAMATPLFGIFITSLASAIMPNLVELGLQGRVEDMLALWQKAMHKCALLMFPCCAFLFPVAGDLMTLLYGPQYADAALPFRVFLCILPLRAGAYSAMLRALAHTKPIAASEIYGLIVNVAFSWALIELGQGTVLAFIAPSIGTVLAQAVAMTVCLFAIKQRLGKGIWTIIAWRELWPLLAIAVGPALFMPLFEQLDLALPLRLLLQGTAYGSVTLTLLIKFRCLDQKELDLLRKPLQILSLRSTR